jgi:hypothetical protein
VECGAGTDHIGYGIVGSNFVEMSARAMHPLFPLCNPFKDPAGLGKGSLRCICRVAAGENLLKGAVRVPGPGLNPGGPYSTARYPADGGFFYNRSHRTDDKTAICPAVEERCCDHVARRTVEGIENKCPHML